MKKFLTLIIGLIGIYKINKDKLPNHANMKIIRLYIAIIIALLAINTFTSCDKDTPEDWSEEINLYVDSEFGEYRP